MEITAGSGARPNTGLTEPISAAAAGASLQPPSTPNPSTARRHDQQALPPLATQRFWPQTILINLWVPIALALLFPAALWLENGQHLNDYYFGIILNVGINVILAVSLQLINGISGQFSLGHAGFMAVGAYLAAYATKTYGTFSTPDNDYDFANPGLVLTYFIALGAALLLAGAALLVVFLAIRQLRRLNAVLPGIAMLAVFGWIVADVAVANDRPILPWFLVWSQGAHALTVIFNGLLAIGPRVQPLFDHFSLAARAPMTLFIALLGGGVIAAGAGLVVGLPTLRLRGDYLAIATLGFGEIIRIAIVNTDALGGATGLAGIPQYHLQDDTGRRLIFPWVFGSVIITFLVIWRLAHSPKGRALAAVREDEVAASAIGIDPTKYKVLAFVIGAFFAGVAGALYAHKDGYLNTDSFNFLRSVELVVMVTIGGLGSLWGAVIAAALLTLLPQVLDSADQFLPAALAAKAHWISANRTVIYALLLILVMIARAKGRGAWRRLTTRGPQAAGA